MIQRHVPGSAIYKMTTYLCRAYYASVAHCSSQTEPSITENTPRSTRKPSSQKRQSSKKDVENWKIKILVGLHNELATNKKNAAMLQNIRHSSVQLIRFAVDDDILSVISFLESFLRGVKRKTKPSPQLDIFLGLSTLLVSRHMNQFVNGSKEPSDHLSTSIYYSFQNLWRLWKFLGTDTRVSFLLLYSSFQKWSTIRPSDEHSRDIEIFMAELRQTVIAQIKQISLVDCSLLLKPADKARLKQMAGEFEIHLQEEDKDSLKYDPNLELVKTFENPCSDLEYLENPFAVMGIEKKHYLVQLENQLRLEKSAWIKVNNYWKDGNPSEAKTAENLIEEWNWKHHIADNLERSLSNAGLYSLKVYLGILNKDELVQQILEAVTATCSLGQNLVPIAVFENNLVSPILRRIHSIFVEKLGIQVDETWRRIMTDYLTYFQDREVARQHVHREWWHTACSKHGIAPDYQAPFIHLHSEIRQELATFFKNLVFEACKVPVPGKYGSVNYQAAFSVRNVAIEEESRVTTEGRYNLAQMVELNSEMLQFFDKHQFQYIMFPTGELPMTVPPRPWIDKGTGGPEFNRSKGILRKLSEYKMVDNNYEMEQRLIKKSQARPVFDALNQLGSTPWIINDSMLEVLSRIFFMSADPSQKEFLDKLSVPLKASAVHIPSEEEFIGTKEADSITKEQWREFYKEKHAAQKHSNEMNSLWYWMMYRVVLAHHYRGNVLFFPHNMDFRGRVYPISPYLNHMGDDINRCILKFAKGKPLGDTGLLWLKLHCINLTGKLKRKSVAERLDEVEKLLPDILDSANKPLEGNRWWMESEEPWQTLAACMELRDALSFTGNVSDFISHLPVHQDGSCNGLQHYAALGRDKQGGLEVNLLPSDVPNDVYSSVAARVEQKRLQDEQGGKDMDIAMKLREAMPQVVPRKVIKQTVMTTVYGVTMYGAVLQIKRQLKAIDINNNEIAQFASYLARKTFDSLHDAFTSSMQLKNWLRGCAKGTNELMRTVEWVTPLGLPVVQPYLRDKITNGRLILAPIPMKQVDAFPPNFVHSLDSTHMMLTSLECSKRGITFAAVHDCFWTHASTVNLMNQVCRDQFVCLHNESIVKKLSEWFHQRYLPPSLISEMTESDKEKYSALFTPRVDPGSLDINDVKKSVYFFS